jgi:hypothetical protein
MQNKGRILVAAVVIVALLAGGFVTGAQWQKVQPVDLAIDWYSEANGSANFDVYTLTENGMVTIYPDPNVTYYGVLKNH